ncbi:MAG: alpha/beta hydrolase [Chloroflexi bacterium]|nr:MAG: alpha/beta hydrolase [Chloroflexota bacterium]TMC29364.1 MAG: alpha/beta hydrolase [Chloroflexota bacterium]TMC37484.1 MAG: alpha/beta hydrolase [Chloroflexota bacterium]TME43587.1 MAG: alpha/beta hydrolase [Chloroflexota bacterium]
MDIQSGYAPADGTHLYYEFAGSGSDVILLHPGQAGIEMWDPQFEEFARHHRTVRYDARGFGRSERPDREYTFYGDLAAVMDALHIERAGLVGCSLGGRTILDFALAYPDRVACMVLVNPGMSGYQFVHLDDVGAAIRAARERGDRAAMVDLEVRTWFDGVGRSAADTDPVVRAKVFRATTERNARDRARGNNPPFRELDAASRLREIGAPTLIVESELDQIDIHNICAQLAMGIRGAERVVIPNAAHLVNLERPKEFAAVVLPFLAAHP